MKIIISVLILILFNSLTFSQCPQSGIKVQSKDCINPKALAVAAINCTELKVKWQGDKNQTYLVKASTANADTESITATPLQVSQPACDNNGNCTASVETTEGTTVNWSVQAVCSSGGITTYSEPVNGPDTYIPICNKANETSSTTGLQVYPSPSKGTLTVDYSGVIDGALQINIYDVNGKQVFTKSVTAVSKTNNQYGLNLHTLASGAYILQTINGSEKKQLKFMLLK